MNSYTYAKNQQRIITEPYYKKIKKIADWVKIPEAKVGFNKV
jgi:hypothetical protein